MIEVKNLIKQYGSFRAVDDVSFSVGREQVLGFLGPNGAGKTTVMKILTGFHFPSGGEALIDGVSVTNDPVTVRQMIGYLPELVPLYGDMTVTEYLRFAAEARCIPRDKQAQAIDKALAECGLEKMAARRIESLSKGYKQRTGLAQAIVHDPPILILDEPTTGLDPNQIIEIRALIKRLGATKTVILSTHILQEVEAVCDRVLILNEGKIAAQGTSEEIAGTMKGGETWTLTLKSAGGTVEESVKARLGAMDTLHPDNIMVQTLRDGVFQTSFFVPSAAGGSETAETATSPDNGEVLFDWALSHQYKILEMSRKRLSLEDIFVQLTREGDE